MSLNLGGPDEGAAARFEARALAALGWEAEDAPVERIARAYREISAGLTSEAAFRSGSGPWSERLADPEAARGAWVLIYGLRTWLAARRILASYPLARSVLHEVGAGWGPFGLACADRARVRLGDLNGWALEASAAIYRAHDFDAPATMVAEGLGGVEDDADLALPFVALEWARRVGEEVVVRELEGRLRGGGRVYVLEQGTKVGGRWLQALGDRLRPWVRAPCPRLSACWMRAAPKDWCHFTWNTRPGPVTRRIADLAGRRWQEQHVAFLVLGGAPGGEGERVLRVRREGRRRVTATVCSASGRDGLVALGRRRDAFEALAGLAPGMLVWVPSSLPRKGDGRVVEQGQALEPQGP